MLFGRSILITTSAPQQTLLARLSAAVLPAASIAPLKPVRVADRIASFRGKRFVGNIEGRCFKLGLLQERGARFRRHGSAVVIVGSIEGRSLRARLRLPLFILAFLCVHALAVSAGLALSFFGPANTSAVHGLLACALVFPLAIVAWLFRREASEAEHALRQTIEGGAAPTRSHPGTGDA